MGFFDFTSILTDPEDKKEYSGISFFPDMRGLELLEEKVLPEEQYRPDKIALRLYQNASLEWVLPIVNGFQDTHKHFTINYVFLYPSKTDLENLGII